MTFECCCNLYVTSNVVSVRPWAFWSQVAAEPVTSATEDSTRTSLYRSTKSTDYNKPSDFFADSANAFTISRYHRKVH